MTADLLSPDYAVGRKLMRTAVRLLARGEPVTTGELGAAAGVDAQCARRTRHRIRRRAPHHRMGPHSHPDATQVHRRRPSSLHLVRRRHPTVSGDPWQAGPGRITLSDNEYSRSADRRSAVWSNRPFPGLGSDLDTSVSGIGCRAGPCQLLQPGSLLRQYGGRRGLARAVPRRNGAAGRRGLSATAPDW
jgi:hypothetical protein